MTDQDMIAAYFKTLFDIRLEDYTKSARTSSHCNCAAAKTEYC